MSDEAITQAAHVEVLYRAARAVIAQHDLQEVFQTIVNGAAEVLQAQQVLLFAVDMQAERITHMAKAGADPEPIVPISFAELNEGLAGWAIRERQIAFSAKAMVIGDPRESPDVRRRRTEMGIGSLLVAPIVREAQVLGILSAVNTMSQPDFTAEDIALIEALAEQAAAAIHNARLLAQAQHKAELLAAGADVTRLISSILSLEEMFPRVVDAIQERFGLYYAGLF
ncbi:MAG TPA: GAF domain-containing protein, partial [Anaerolineae bacterium]|nr:GAF domain-containing protein [Anaerolineae bacterium]